MASVTRRTFLKSSAALGCGAALPRRAQSAAAPLPLEAIGKVRPRPSAAIVASPLGVGFETLDRKMFVPERTYPYLAQLGVKWARVQTGWCRCEPVKGQYDFAWLDAAVDRLRQIEIQPWFNLGYGNRLYTPETADEFAVGWAPLGSEAIQQGWLRFVRALAERFGDRVKHWEIWNEPNISNFWKPHKSDPAEYVRLVRLTAPVIRRAVPGAMILGPAVWGPAYFQSCFELGLGELVDKVTYHWYRAAPEDKYEASIAACRAVLAQQRLKLPLWQGESGCPSKSGGAGALSKQAWNEDLQARWVLRRTMSDLRMRVEMTSYFHTVDVLYPRLEEPGRIRLGGMNYKGLLRGEDYTPKPAYFAYQCLCALFDAQSQWAELPLDAAAPPGEPSLDQAALLKASFLRDGKPLYAYWLPANLLGELRLRSVNLTIPETGAGRLDAPVLIDPLRATVHRLPRAERAQGRWTVAGAPLADYPLIVADKATVL